MPLFPILPFLLAQPPAADRPRTAADCVRLAAECPCDKDTRFIALWWEDDEEEIGLWRARLAFVLNSLSRRRRMTAPTPVPGSGGVLLCVSLRDYGISAAAWDDLLYRGSGPMRLYGKKERACPDFYLDVPAKGGKGLDTFPQPMVDGPAFKKLTAGTGTDYPIASADWFLYHATLTPAYYTLLGFKDDDDFDRLVRFREKDRDDLATKGIISQSLETRLNNGTLLRTPTVLGHYWESFGYRSSLGNDDLFKNLLRRSFDEKLVLASLPNGLQAYVAVDKDDKTLVPASDVQIEVNRVADRRWMNKTLFPGASCMQCHARGLREITDEVRLTTAFARRVGILPRVGHIPKDMDEADKIRADLDKVKDLFFEDLDSKVEEDQNRFEAAVKRCNGLSGEENRAAFEAAFVRYAQEPVTLQVAARRLGLTAAGLRGKLEGGVNLDPALVRLLAGRPVRPDQWYFSAMPQLMRLLAGGGKP